MVGGNYALKSGMMVKIIAMNIGGDYIVCSVTTGKVFSVKEDDFETNS